MTAAKDQRLASGIPGLDDITKGGLFPESTYLLAGGPGTGKTILSLQWLRMGAELGERCLFISLCEPAGQIQRNVRCFGWDLAGITFTDLTPAFDPDAEPGGEYQVMAPAEVEQVPLWKGIYHAVREHRPQRLVIDSATQLRHLSTDEFQFRKHIQTLVQFLNHHRTTCLISFEPTELQKETSIALAVDGIFSFRYEVSHGRLIGLRSLEIDKFRGSDFLTGRHPLRIGTEGVVVFPHRISDVDNQRPASDGYLATTIPELDALLCGGVETGTSTIISGPTGVGKTLLGFQFMVESARQGKRATVYVFEESASSVIRRTSRLGLPIQDLMGKGLLNIVQVNPLQVYPDELLAMVRHEVEILGCKTLMIDSLRGYDLAMEQFGSIVAHMQNLVNYLGSRQITTFLVNEVEHLTGDLRVTELGVSYLSDNVILLRYCENAGRIIKVVACLKKRLGDFQPELRELEIRTDGLRVGPQFHHLHGILTGVPHGNGSSA